MNNDEKNNEQENKSENNDDNQSDSKDDQNKQIFDNYIRTNYAMDINTNGFDTENAKKEYLRKIRQDKKQIQKLEFYKVFKYAAAAVIVFGLGYFFQQDSFNTPIEETPIIVSTTIEPGTDVRGAADGVLLVARGSKLEAIGTAAQPITFSSLADEDYTPETAGVIANVTIIGGDAANSAGEFGMRLRGSVTAAIHNSAVTGYDVTCARIDDSDHDNDSATAKIDTPITMRNFLCDTAGAAFNKEEPVSTDSVILEAVVLDANKAITNASASVTAEAITAQDNGSSFVFDSTDYIGAVKAGEIPWYSGWAITGSVQ